MANKGDKGREKAHEAEIARRNEARGVEADVHGKAAASAVKCCYCGRTRGVGEERARHTPYGCCPWPLDYVPYVPDLEIEPREVEPKVVYWWDK